MPNHQPRNIQVVRTVGEITRQILLGAPSGLISAAVGPCANATLAVSGSIRGGDALADISVPLRFYPGAVWEYSPGFGFRRAGTHWRDRFRGLALDKLLRQRLVRAARDAQTTFSLPREELPRLAALYETSVAPGCSPARPCACFALSMLASIDGPDNPYSSGGAGRVAGLVGTAEDYSRFLLRPANDGQFAGERLLGHKTVVLMATTTSASYPSSAHRATCAATASRSECACWRMSLGVDAYLAPTFGWAGVFDGNVWVDLVEQVVGMSLIQRRHRTTRRTPEPRPLWPRWQMTGYQVIEA